MIPNCIPYINGDEKKYLNEALDTNSIAIGRFIAKFENHVAAYTNSSYAIAVSSGTAALHLALLANNISKDDEVIVPDLTFAATGFAIRYCDAWPLFVDCNPDTGIIDLKKLRYYLEENCYKKEGKLFNKQTDRIIRAIIPVHLYGHPVDMNELLNIVNEYKLILIQDAAEALGSEYKEKPLGSFGHTSILSFNGNKLITSGSGGMVLTDEKQISEKVRYLANQSKKNEVDFVHGDIGYNYRMPNVNAAIGLAQMEQIEEFIKKKRYIMATYGNFFKKIKNISMVIEKEWAKSNYWMPIIQIDTSKYKKQIHEIISQLHSAGVEVRPVWKPLSQQPAFRKCQKINNNNSLKFFSSSICLPCSISITDKEIKEVCNSLMDVLHS